MCSRPETWPSTVRLSGPPVQRPPAARTGGKAPAGPGQLQEEIKPLFPGKRRERQRGRLFLPGNGQRPVQIGRLLPPGAKDGGVDAVGNDGDGDSGQGGGRLRRAGQSSGSSPPQSTGSTLHKSPETPPGGRCPVSQKAGSLGSGPDADAAVLFPAAAGACVAAASGGKFRMEGEDGGNSTLFQVLQQEVQIAEVPVEALQMHHIRPDPVNPIQKMPGGPDAAAIGRPQPGLQAPGPGRTSWGKSGPHGGSALRGPRP